MSKPYLEVYRDEDEKAVLVYVEHVSIEYPVDADYIKLNPDHIDDIIEQLKQFKKESE